MTADLAAHMPYGAPNPPPFQDSTQAHTNSAHAPAPSLPAPALTPHNNQLIQLDGATGDLFSPLSMDLTNNSFDFHRQQQQLNADRSPLVMPPLPPVSSAPTLFVPQPPQPPPLSEYTRNITSAIPALSTLVEVRPGLVHQYSTCHCLPLHRAQEHCAPWAHWAPGGMCVTGDGQGGSVLLALPTWQAGPPG